MKKQTTKIPFVSIMIAALNEEKNIVKVIEDCKKLKGLKIEVLVVLDDKTTDKTAEVSRKAGARVIQTGKWGGKGAALKKAQKEVKGDYIVQIDADYQFMPHDIPKLIDALTSGYDVALGSRYENGAIIHKDSVTGFRVFGIRFLSIVATIVCRQRVSDIPAGFKAFKTNVLKKIDFKIPHYGYEAEEVVRAARLGYKIKNVPIEYRKRAKGGSNLNPIKDGLLFLKVIVKTGIF